VNTAGIGEAFEVTGWQGTGGVTLGFRFGSENARTFVDRRWHSVEVELEGVAHEFPIRPPFWRTCPEIRGAPITTWLTRHRLAPWPRGNPPRIRMVYLGANRFRAEALK
jgi:hypothetical protein